MSDLRVPTVATGATVSCADGRRFEGRIFLPASSPTHAGAMRPEEWLDLPATFFPFLPDDAPAPVLMNKGELLVLSVPAPEEESAAPGEAPTPRRRLRVELGGARVDGVATLALPKGMSRVLDLVNAPGRFLALRDGDRLHLVHKARITRVIEPDID